MENGLVSPVDEGTPQGGPLSLLLSNIVLDAGFGLRGMRMIVVSTFVAGGLGTSDGRHQAVHHGAA
jgi:hypothetical protein